MSARSLPTVRVLIVDDHPTLVDALKLSLEIEQHDGPGIEVIASPGFSTETVLETARREAPDVVLLDVDLGTGDLNVDLVAPLTDAGQRVVLFTGWTGAALLGEALEAGATGILSKSDTFERLLVGIRDVAAGRAITRPAERDALVAEAHRVQAIDRDHESRLSTLTPRERAILSLLARGRSADQIAMDEVVSVSTVRSHIKSILRKLGVTSQLAAVALFRSK